MTDAPASVGLASADWRALGTGVRLVVHRAPLAAARAAVEDVLERVDRTYSRFRPDSELLQLGARPGSWQPISPLLGEAIAAALRAAALSDGAVDPTVGRAMRAIGYDADFEAIRTPGGPIELRLEPIPGWRAVELGSDGRSVRVRSGVELDLGSVGKGLAADLAVRAAFEAISPMPGGGVLVSLGGDLAVAGTAPPGGWRILLAEDSEAPAPGDGDVVAIREGAIATSSTTVRRWTRGDVTYHHLVDPRTGGPVESPWRTATVAAGTCVDANTAATAAIVLGSGAVTWLERVRLPARLVATDGSIVTVGRWPAPTRGAANA